MYVVRLGVDNGKVAYRDAKPCKHCLMILKSYGIRKVCYTTSSGYCIENVNTMETNHVSHGIAAYF